MRKTWVKILVPILVLAIVFTCVHIAVTGNNRPDDTTFTFAVEDGNAILTGSQDALSGAVMLPAEIEGYTVTGIGENAFKDCADVTAFFLPDSIASIGAYAFENCTALAQMILPEGLVSIGEGAFWKCVSLRSVTIPVSVSQIGACAFFKCDALESLIVPGATTPVKGIFNISLDIGQTIAVGNPARTVLDPIVTTVYCYNGSVAHAQTLADEYSDYVLLDDCALTSYTVQYVDENGVDVVPSKTVSLQPVGIEVAAVAAVPDADDLQYPETAMQTKTLSEGENVITFVYEIEETTTESTTESTTEETTTETTTESTTESTTEEPTTEEPTTEEPTTEESTTEESTTEEPTTEEPTTEEPTTEESTTEEPTTEETTTEPTTEESTTEESTTETTTEEPSTEPPYEAPVLLAREGSGAVIDREHGYIYGVEEDMDYDTLCSKYLEVRGDGRIVSQKNVWIGTGTKIYLVDRDGTTLETLTIILFGDLNRDAIVGADDVVIWKGLLSGAVSEEENPDLVFAADMDQDGVYDLSDRNIIMGISTGAVDYSQTLRKVL